MQSSQESHREFAPVNGARLAYQMAGQGRPLVLIHAGIADSRMWDEHFEEFSRHFRVIRYDIRGFGQSVMPAGTYADHDDLFGLLTALSIAKASILGVSFGAKIALDFALDHPDMMEALVLTSPALGGRTPSALSQQQDDEIDAVYETGDLAGAVELELRRWVDGPNRTPGIVDQAVREKVREMDSYNFDLAGEEGVQQPLDPPAAGRLGEIRTPTLVIVGDGDVPDTLENAETLSAGIEGAQKKVIHNTAHMLSMEKPQEFNRLVVNFLNAL